MLWAYIIISVGCFSYDRISVMFCKSFCELVVQSLPDPAGCLLDGTVGRNKVSSRLIRCVETLQTP